MQTIDIAGVHVLDQHGAGGVPRGGRADAAAQEEEEAPPVVRALPQDTAQEGLRLAPRVSTRTLSKSYC